MQAIKDRIVEEANESAEQVIERARQQASRYIAEAEAEAGKMIVSAEAEAVQIKETRLNRARSMSSLDKRKAALKARQQLVDKAISEAVRNLCGLPAAEKTSLYQDILRSQDDGASTAEVVFARQDSDISEKAVEPFDGRFKVADASGHFSGGLVIKRGRIEENLTFDLIIKNYRSELVQTAAGILYPADVELSDQDNNNEQPDKKTADDKKEEGIKA